jgi:hypothetical protein
MLTNVSLHIVNIAEITIRYSPKVLSISSWFRRFGRTRISTIPQIIDSKIITYYYFYFQIAFFSSCILRQHTLQTSEPHGSVFFKMICWKSVVHFPNAKLTNVLNFRFAYAYKKRRTNDLNQFCENNIFQFTFVQYCPWFFPFTRDFVRNNWYDDFTKTIYVTAELVGPCGQYANILPFFVGSFVPIVGLLCLLGLRTEGHQSFTSLDVYSELSLAISLYSSSSEDGSYLLPFSSSV